MNSMINKVSCILLNWKRTGQVKELSAQLNGFDTVDEILVWNNNPDIFLQLPENKARVINSSEDFGLFTRFSAASLARNPCILFHDDDIVAPEKTLGELFGKWKKDPYRCHSATYGRNPKNGQYSLNSHYGPVEIILTRYTMIHRSVCVHALSRIHEFADIPGEPPGNGEDIILSYAAIEYSGRLNMAYRLETRDIKAMDEYAISNRFPGHISHRSEIIHRCGEVFKIRSRLKAWNRICQFFAKLNVVRKRGFRSKMDKLKK